MLRVGPLKARLFLGLILLLGTLSIATQAQQRVSNGYAQSFPGISHNRYYIGTYISSGMTEERIRKILGIPKLSDRALEERIEDRKDERGRSQPGSGGLAQPAPTGWGLDLLSWDTFHRPPPRLPTPPVQMRSIPAHFGSP